MTEIVTTAGFKAGIIIGLIIGGGLVGLVGTGFWFYSDFQATLNFKHQIREVLEPWKLEYDNGTRTWNREFKLTHIGKEHILFIVKVGFTTMNLDELHLIFPGGHDYNQKVTGYSFDADKITWGLSEDFTTTIKFSIDTRLVAEINDISWPISWL